MQQHVGTVQYVVVIDKRVEYTQLRHSMLKEGTVVAHRKRNSHGLYMSHEACIVENMLSHTPIDTDVEEQRVKQRRAEEKLADTV